MELIFDKKLDEHVYQYFLRDKDKQISFSQIRTTPTKSNIMPKDFESHIYYETHKNFRNRGYGKEILKLTLNKAKELKLNKIILTCLNSNIPSKKIIILNDAKLVESKTNAHGDKVNKYIILLKSSNR